MTISRLSRHLEEIFKASARRFGDQKCLFGASIVEFRIDKQAIAGFPLSSCSKHVFGNLPGRPGKTPPLIIYWEVSKNV